MALPMPANNTCDIYRNANNPPAAPDVAAVPCYIVADYSRRLEGGEGDVGSIQYTHVMVVASTIDVRDNRTSIFAGPFPDRVWVPDKDGTKFDVIWVERRNRGLPTDHKKVYLSRHYPTWPTNNL